MKNLNFSIGILSWRGYKSLYNSLKSYEKNGLNSLTHSKFICLPEYNNEGIKICKNFGYKPILFKNNIDHLLCFYFIIEKCAKRLSLFYIIFSKLNIFYFFDY